MKPTKLNAQAHHNEIKHPLLEKQTKMKSLNKIYPASPKDHVRKK